MNKETKQIIWANAYSMSWLQGNDSTMSCDNDADHVLNATQNNFKSDLPDQDEDCPHEHDPIVKQKIMVGALKKQVKNLSNEVKAKDRNSEHLRRGLKHKDKEIEQNNIKFGNEINRLKDLDFVKNTRISWLENDRSKNPSAYKQLQLKVSELETQRDHANRELATLSNAYRELHVKTDHRAQEIKKLEQLIWDAGVEGAAKYVYADHKKYNECMAFAKKGKNHG